MTKKEFFKLLNKYKKGTCTEAEIKLLNEYCETIQIKGIEESWPVSEREDLRLRIFENIISNIDKELFPLKKRKYSLFKGASVAAATILLVTSAAIFYHYNSDSSVEIPKDAITLQLEDGSIQVIDEHGNSKVLDAEGNVLGQQQGNALSYFGSENNKIQYNILRVPHGKTFNINLSDGTIAHLNAGTSMRFPSRFIGNKERNVIIEGEVFLEVKKDPTRPFIVTANELNIRVLGTKFNINAYPEDADSEVVLVEGSVAMYPKQDNFIPRQTTVLSPGNKGIFRKDSRKISKTQVLTNLYTSWMTGELVFRNKTLENILKKLERRYDVKFINHNTKLINETFNASFAKDVPLMQVLDELKLMYGLNYEAKDNVIIINN